MSQDLVVPETRRRDGRRPADRTPGPVGGAPSRPRRRRSIGAASPLEALLWIGPALALILGVVVFPMVMTVLTSLNQYSLAGTNTGFVGFENYVRLLARPEFAGVALNSAVWVVGTVTITIVLGLALGQFLSQDFFGRRFVRWAVVIPWAAAHVMSAQLFKMAFSYNGILNQMLLDTGVIREPIDWLSDGTFVMPAMIAVGVFVSVPFTAYLFVAGLSAIPGDVYEAARIDGAGRWRTYFSITLPLLRPALLIGVVLNMIHVFNSFPIIWVLNGRNPGFANDTLITYMYKLAFRSADLDVGLSAATGVINVGIILIAVAFYLRVSSPRKEQAS